MMTFEQSLEVFLKAAQVKADARDAELSYKPVTKLVTMDGPKFILVVKEELQFISKSQDLLDSTHRRSPGRQRILPFGRSRTGDDVQRRLPVEIIPGKPNTIPRSTEKLFGSAPESRSRCPDSAPDSDLRPRTRISVCHGTPLPWIPHCRGRRSRNSLKFKSFSCNTVRPHWERTLALRRYTPGHEYRSGKRH
jgi:hypothetical protein